MLLVTANEVKPNTAQSNASPNQWIVTGKCHQLDNYAFHLFGENPWKSRLQVKHHTDVNDVTGVTHYQEFLSRRPRGCGHKNYNRNFCRECKTDATMDHFPSSLIKLIRHTYEHAVEKMEKNPGGVLDTILFPKPKRYSDTTNFFCIGIQNFLSCFQ